MNILIMANRDMPANFAINQLLNTLPEHNYSLILSSRVGGTGKKPERLRPAGFFDQTLFNTILDPLMAEREAPAGKLANFSQLNQRLVRPWVTMNREVNSEAGLAWIEACKPDVIVSLRFGHRMKNPLLGIPKYGVINLHSGRLPDYRGVMATFRAMLADDTHIGTTLHYIDDDEIDTGKVLATTNLPIEPGRSYWWHVMQLYPEGVRKIAEVLQHMAAGERPEGSPQPPQNQYFSYPDDNDLDAFFAKGLKLVDEAEVTEFLQTWYI